MSTRAGTPDIRRTLPRAFAGLELSSEAGIAWSDSRRGMVEAEAAVARDVVEVQAVRETTAPELEEAVAATPAAWLPGRH